MAQFQKWWLIGLFILTLLTAACQSVGEPDQLPPQETAISQAATVASPTVLPTSTPQPILLTPSPTTTPTLVHTNQGDQFPTHPPTSPPTATAIPAEALASPTATRSLPTPAAAPVPTTEVDLPALEESLVLLDRLERRKDKPERPLVGPIIYQGKALSVTEKDVNCDDCNETIFSAEIFIESNGTMRGKLDAPIGTNNDAVSFAGTVNSITQVFNLTQFNRTFNCYAQCTGRLQASLVDNGQKFEGTIDESCTHCGTAGEYGFIWTFSLDRQ